MLWNDPIASDLIGIDDLVIRQDIFLFLFKMFRLYFIVLDFFKLAQHIVNNIYIYIVRVHKHYLKGHVCCFRWQLWKGSDRATSLDVEARTN